MMGAWEFIAERLSIGAHGSTAITDTETHNGSWRAIYVTAANTAFTTLTDASRDGNAITGITCAANHILYGEFTAIKLSAGACIAYK
jgi:hypothetical protein